MQGNACSKTVVFRQSIKFVQWPLHSVFLPVVIITELNDYDVEHAAANVQNMQGIDGRKATYKYIHIIRSQSCGQS